MLLETVVVGPFQCNCRILVCPKTGHAALVDPGDEPSEILDAVGKLRTPSGLPIQVKRLLHTHAHLDHIGATRDVKLALAKGARAAENPAQISLHRGDAEIYANLKMQGQLFGIDYEDPLPIEHYLEHEEQFQLGELKLSVIHTPGHSPGSVSIRLHEDSGLGAKELIFSGDTLFQGSVGRTDLWGANGDLMFKCIRERLLTLDEDTAVCPGHGPDTTIGIEKRKNPFLT